MRRWMSVLAFALTAALAAACNAGDSAAPESPAGGSQPYAGLETPPIKALAPERAADLLAGRGAGYALAAELNHFPGPTHVLELASALGLQPEQERRVREVFSAMQREAQRYGKQLLDLEAELNQAFSAGTITPAELARLTGAIAAVEGRLRGTHLAAHLETKSSLTPEQVARYDRLRGYEAGAGDLSAGEGGHHTGGQHGKGDRE